MPGQGFDTSVFKFVVFPLTSAFLINAIVIMTFYCCRYQLFRKVQGSWIELLIFVNFGEGLLLMLLVGTAAFFFASKLEALAAVIWCAVATMLIQWLLIFVAGVLHRQFKHWCTQTEEGVRFVCNRFKQVLDLKCVPYATLEIDHREGSYSLVVFLFEPAWKDRIPSVADGVPVSVQTYGRTVLWLATGSTNSSQPDAIVHKSD